MATTTRYLNWKRRLDGDERREAMAAVHLFMESLRSL